MLQLACMLCLLSGEESASMVPDGFAVEGKFVTLPNGESVELGGISWWEFKEPERRILIIGQTRVGLYEYDQATFTLLPGLPAELRKQGNYELRLIKPRAGTILAQKEAYIAVKIAGNLVGILRYRLPIQRLKYLKPIPNQQLKAPWPIAHFGTWGEYTPDVGWRSKRLACFRDGWPERTYSVTNHSSGIEGISEITPKPESLEQTAQWFLRHFQEGLAKGKTKTLLDDGRVGWKTIDDDTRRFYEAKIQALEEGRYCRSKNGAFSILLSEKELNCHEIACIEKLLATGELVMLGLDGRMKRIPLTDEKNQRYLKKKLEGLKNGTLTHRWDDGICQLVYADGSGPFKFEADEAAITTSSENSDVVLAKDRAGDEEENE